MKKPDQPAVAIPTIESLVGIYVEATDESQGIAGGEAKRQEKTLQIGPRREDLFGVTVTFDDQPQIGGRRPGEKRE